MLMISGGLVREEEGEERTEYAVKILRRMDIRRTSAVEDDEKNGGI